MNTTNWLLFYLVFAIFALAIVLMVRPTLLGDNKKRVTKKSSSKKSKKK